ncbi:MAG TPA: BLUF domain-containing protein [Sphingomonas sp.]|nr:BLUF domain-containing protein [Sphingomonas sp.]
MNQLVTWLYVSRSTLSPDQAAAAIAEIVHVSRARNAELKVTGALAFTGAAFGQFLEGPVESVEAVRASISRDARHEDILTVAEGAAPQRVFADWSLAYSGASSFFGRVLERVRQDHPRRPSQSARELTQLLFELAH